MERPSLLLDPVGATYRVGVRAGEEVEFAARVAEEPVVDSGPDRVMITGCVPEVESLRSSATGIAPPRSPLSSTRASRNSSKNGDFISAKLAKLPIIIATIRRSGCIPISYMI